jgi:hypothetical protein
LSEKLRPIESDSRREDFDAVERKVQDAYRDLEAIRKSSPKITNGEELEALEGKIRSFTDELARLIFEHQLQQALDSEELKEAQRRLIKAWPGRLKNEGKQPVRICIGSGLWVTVRVSYYRRRCDRRKKKRGKGVYAGLVILGVHERCTPVVSSRVSMLTALLSSFKEARQVLSEQGFELGVKVIRKVAYRYAARARVIQQSQAFCLGEELPAKGRRVVVSCDGGKIRLRENKRGPKTAKRRTRYKGAWREPRLLIIYVVDEQGRPQRSFAPVIDGSLNAPEAVFELMRSYLRALALHPDDQLLFVADGAPWIWNRVPGLIKALGLAAKQVHELLDFYHGVEHLAEVAKLRKSWSAKQRKSWVKKHRRLLLKGQVSKVIDAVRELCRGRNSKAIRTEREYFVKNQHRMDYARLKANHWPIGSGAVESAIRRVINLRLKGPGIFWYRGNAEAMLMLRAYYKAGRWNLLKNMANSHLSVMVA